MTLSLPIIYRRRKLLLTFDVSRVERIPAEPDIGIVEDIENYTIEDIFVTSMGHPLIVPQEQLNTILTELLSREGEYGDVVAEMIMEASDGH